MTLTDKQVDGLLDTLMMEAKRQRMNIPYSRVDAFPQAVVMLGQNFETASIPAMWKNEDEKYHVMRAVSATAKKSLCRAVILISDTRWTTATPELCEFLGVPPPDEIGVDAWGKRYSRAITERFDGQLKNLPRQYWQEAIVIVMKAPELHGKIPLRMAQYERGPNDTIHWLPMKDDDYRAGHFNLLPDWWD